MRFRYHVAGPARRALAYLIDALVRGAILLLFAMVTAMAGVGVGDAFQQASTGLLLLVAFLLEWGYYLLFELTSGGRTPGKRALGLRVVTSEGQALGFTESLLRNLLRAADFLPSGYALGVLVMGRDPRFRRLGDLVAGTMVVVEDRRAVSAPLRIEPPPTPAELHSLPQRVPLSGEELDGIELLLRREGKLSVAREIELAQMVAPVFARRLGLGYRDPIRFLKVLYARARGARADAGPAAWRRR